MKDLTLDISKAFGFVSENDYKALQGKALESNAALYVVLIVHTVQTMLVVLLGVWGWASLWLTSPITSSSGPKEKTINHQP